MKPDKHGPAGLAVDVLYDVRRALRWLRKTEKRLQGEIRAEKRRQARAQ